MGAGALYIIMRIRTAWVNLWRKAGAKLVETTMTTLYRQEKAMTVISRKMENKTDSWRFILIKNCKHKIRAFFVKTFRLSCRKRSHS